MCTTGLAPLDTTKAVKCYKSVAKLKDGTLVAIVPHLRKSKEQFVYKNGKNTKVGNIGLHTYVNQDLAEKLCEVVASMEKNTKDTESYIVLNATIPPRTKAEVGYWQVEGQDAYVSDDLVIDAKNVLAEYPVKKNRKLFQKLTRELHIID